MDTSILIAVIVPLGGALFWHFKTVNSFKDEIHSLKMKMKDLEHRDEMQQQTLNQINTLYPIIEKAIEKLGGSKMNQQYIDYSRLSELGNKVRTGNATKSERDEYMLMLYRNGSITWNQYSNYTSGGSNSDEILKGALAIGAVVLIGYLLSEIFKSK